MIGTGVTAALLISAWLDGFLAQGQEASRYANAAPAPGGGTAPAGHGIQCQAEDGQWSVPGKNYALTRFSGLNQIDRSNVGNLKLAWTMSTGTTRGNEAAPIVVNNTMYVIDRTSGEVISSNPYSYLNTTTPPDPKTGRPTVPESKRTGAGKLTHDICPAFMGGKDWQPSAFSPVTNLLYIPHQNVCQDFQGLQPNFISGTPYVAGVLRMYAGPGNGHRGEYTAYDPVNARIAWTVNERFPVWSGTVVTATNVAFYGTMDGWFKAVDMPQMASRCGNTKRATASSASPFPIAAPTAGNTSPCWAASADGQAC